MSSQFFIELKRPTEQERLRLWKQMIPKKVPLGREVNDSFFEKISAKFDLSGGQISDSIYRACATAAIYGKRKKSNDSDRLIVTKTHLWNAAKEEVERASLNNDFSSRLFI